MLSIAKLQNLKAIHNLDGHGGTGVFVVINRKTTKFESNSQHARNQHTRLPSCYQSQNYKIWKQFTTPLLVRLRFQRLLSIAKLQNLKAIHNKMVTQWAKQRVVINRKTTKFESNSQLRPYCSEALRCCYQSQNYKIWKQFTTGFAFATHWRSLLSIAKLQNLKAIHNK